MEQSPSLEATCLSHSPSMTLESAASQAKLFRGGAARIAAAVKLYDPTLVIYFGPDHMRALKGISPCFTIAESAKGYGDWNAPSDPYDVPSDVARNLTKHLLESGIDVAAARDIALDHGFSLTMGQVFGSLNSVKMIPIIVNCVGEPLARMTRVSALGRSVRTFLQGHFGPRDRLLVVGSGGLSHSPPNMTMKNFGDLDHNGRRAALLDAGQQVSPEWDSRFLERIQSRDWNRLETLRNDEIAVGGPGANELRCWIAAAFTVNAPLQLVAYEPVPEWITGMGVVATSGLADLGERHLI